MYLIIATTPFRGVAQPPVKNTAFEILPYRISPTQTLYTIFLHFSILFHKLYHFAFIHLCRLYLSSVAHMKSINYR